MKIDIFDGTNCQKFNKTTLIRNRLGVNEHVANSSIYKTKQRKRKLHDEKHFTLTEFWSGIQSVSNSSRIYEVQKGKTKISKISEKEETVSLKYSSN